MLLQRLCPQIKCIYGAMHMYLTLSLITTQSVIESGSLFTLLNAFAVLLFDSHKRVVCGRVSARTSYIDVDIDIDAALQLERRPLCLAKDIASRKVFQSFVHPDNRLFVDINVVSTAIPDDDRGFIVILLKYWC